MAREVARFNTLQQNAQTLSTPLNQTVLYRAKKEILQCVEMLIDKMQTDIANLLVEVMDITLHCVDSTDLKNKPLQEVCPSICKFNQVSHCFSSRRISVGASNGHLAIYDLRHNKCQMIPAHSNPVTALAFSPDGKFLVSYACKDNKLAFWQTSTGKRKLMWRFDRNRLILNFRCRYVRSGSEPDQVYQRIFHGTAGGPHTFESNATGQVDLDQ